MTQTSEHTAGRRGARREHPQDRFDRVHRSGRVGAHRITARPRYVWQYLIAGLLGFALLTTAGIITVHSIGGAGQLPANRPSTGGSSTQAPLGELDPEATVAVLNGTETPNLAAAVDQIITQEQWGQIRFSGSAAASDVTISAVFYTDPADEAAAEGLAAKLGGLSSYITEDYANYEVRLVVLLGSDYKGPGLEEAKQITAEGTDEPVPDGGADEPEIDPDTGWPIDPATGWPIDPETGQPTDPATLPAS